MGHIKNLLKKPEQGLLLLFEVYHRRYWKDHIDELLPHSVQDNVFLQGYAQFFGPRTLLQVNPITGFVPHVLSDVRQKFQHADHKQYYDKKKNEMKAYIKLLDAEANWLASSCFTRNGMTHGRFDPDKVPPLYDLQRNDAIQFLLAYNIIRAYHGHLITYLTKYQSKRLNLTGKTLFMNPIEFRNMMCIVLSSPKFVEDLKAILKHYQNYIPKIPPYRVNPTGNERLTFYYCTKKLSNDLQQDMEHIAIIPAESQSVSSDKASLSKIDLDSIPLGKYDLDYLDNVCGRLSPLDNISTC